jgi:hypothetical protein
MGYGYQPNPDQPRRADQPLLPGPLKRGKKRDFSLMSFLLLAVVAVTMRSFRDIELWKLLQEDSALRKSLGFERVPHRTTIGRRLSNLVPEAREQIALLGEQVKPEPDQPSISAIDERMYKAVGPSWHKSDRQKDLVPVNLRRRYFS